MSTLVEQAGVDCILVEVRRLHICHAQKLRDTMDGKDGDKYTEEEMKVWGFIAREAE